MKWFLKFCMALSALFILWLPGLTNWYLMSLVGIVIFKPVGDSLSMKWDPRLITRLFKSVVNYVKGCIFSCHFYSLFLLSGWQYNHIHTWRRFICLPCLMTGSSTRCTLRSHSLLYIENHLFIVGIVPILSKQPKFIYQYDRSDCT